MKILITGSDGNLINEFKKTQSEHDIFYASKIVLDVSNFDNIRKFVDTHTSFDLVIGSAYIYQTTTLPVETKIFDITSGHAELARSLKAKHFINFTTALVGFDEHFPYRAVKTYIEDFYYRFFKWEMPETTFHNIYPGHLDDKQWLVKAALLLHRYIDTIDNYHEINYAFDDNNTITKDENKTLRR